MNRQQRCHELFHFREDMQAQSSIIACPRSQRQCWQAIFSLDTEIFFLNYCYYCKCVNASKLLFCLIVPLRSEKKPSKFSKSVHVVLSMSEYSLTTPTFQHVSPKSLTTPTRCQHSQQLRGTRNFRKYQMAFLIAFIFIFLHSRK